MKELLRLLERNGNMTAAELAAVIGRDEAEIAETLRECEEKKIILGYRALVDWERAGVEAATAQIDLKVTPQRGEGFARVAERICQYDEVESVALMSGGGFDLAVTITGRSLREVALFVAEKLAPLDCVTSTATHFVLKKFKEGGVRLAERVGEQERLTRL